MEKKSLSNKRATIIWFTGLSGSGKSTIAKALAEHLKELGKGVSILDGDVIRATLHKDLGFSREEIKENNRLVAELAKKESAKFDLILVPIISPYREDRKMAREILGENFIELFVDCDLQKCIQRDPKGLYKKAKTGEIDNMIGYSPASPYELPLNPDISVSTDMMSEKESVSSIIKQMEEKGLI